MVTLETQPVVAVIQRWSAYTVEPVYIVVTLETQPVVAVIEVVCLVEPVYSGHP